MVRIAKIDSGAGRKTERQNAKVGCFRFALDEEGGVRRNRPIPRSEYHWHPKAKGPSLRWEVILGGAAVRMPDGREITQPNALGDRLYVRRVREMVQRQNFRCPMCGNRLNAAEATFEHARRRGMHGFKRDDRILDENGNWINSATHWICNVKKG
jgi:hypothetical protein